MGALSSGRLRGRQLRACPHVQLSGFAWPCMSAHFAATLLALLAIY